MRSAASEPERAAKGIHAINKLFEQERLWRRKPPDERRALRQISSIAIADGLFAWAQEQVAQVYEGSPIYKALRYLLNQKKGLRAFLSDGRLPLDNNHSERELRQYAVGRKNWLFIGSKDGGEANARFSSLLASCRMHDIEPVAYLRDLLCLLPQGWPQDQLLDLAPVNWKTTSQRQDVIALLESDPVRRFSMP